MCGLAGVIDLKGRREPDRAQVARMGAALTHRGPDDAGTLFAPGIGAASQRLSIVGLSNGQQPIFNEDRTRRRASATASCSTIRSARPSFRRGAIMFRTGSDCELIVHLYEEHGEDLFPHLKGQFAFALFDFAKRVVILARDRVGICPLIGRGRATSFISAPRSRRCSPPAPCRPVADVRGLDHLFTFFALGSRRTMFEGVQSILPGHYLRIAFNRDGRAAEPVERRYWDLDFPDWGDEDDASDPTALIDEFEETFRRAVEIRLRADVPVVGYLSGGVDSAYVLATACQGPRARRFRASPSRSRTQSSTRKPMPRSRRVPSAAPQPWSRPAPNVIAENYAALIEAAETPGARHVLRRAARAVARGACARLQGGAHRRRRRRGALPAMCGSRSGRRRARSISATASGRAPASAASRGNLAAPTLSFGEFARIDDMIAGPHAQSILYNLVATSRTRYYSAEPQRAARRFRRLSGSGARPASACAAGIR